MTSASLFTSGVAPGAVPMAGHGLEVQQRPLEFFRSLHAHGDLVEIKLGDQAAYVVCHPDLLHEVLSQDRIFDKGGVFYDTVRETVGNGLGNCPYADHRRQRRLVQPAFTPAQLSTYGSVMEQEIRALTEGWKTGDTLDVYPVLHGLYLRILTRTVFSTQVDEETVGSIQRASKATLSMLVARMSNPDPNAAPNEEYQRAHQYLCEEVDRLIAACRAAGADRGDLLSTLITSRDEDSGSVLTDAEIRDIVINLLLAGSETPAAAVTWALQMLEEHPEQRERLYQEVDAVLGGRQARWSDLPELGYTSRFLKETMRIYPGAWMVTRATSAEVELAGITLPAGATVVFSPLAVHHRADVYAEPERFDPDRWLPGSATALPRYAFTTFGGGARRCIGDNYTTSETALTLASIAASWRLIPGPGSDPTPTTATGSLRPEHLVLRLQHR